MGMMGPSQVPSPTVVRVAVDSCPFLIRYKMQESHPQSFRSVFLAKPRETQKPALRKKPRKPRDIKKVKQLVCAHYRGPANKIAVAYSGSAMDLMQSFDAILFPADGRCKPRIVSLMTSPASFSNPHAPAQMSTARVPHPEVYMEYIAVDPNLRAWHHQVCTVFFIIIGVWTPSSLHGFLFPPTLRPRTVSTSTRST
jgi:hypothetical protein